MEKDEKVIIKTSQFSRELLEKMHADIKKNEALKKENKLATNSTKKKRSKLNDQT